MGVPIENLGHQAKQSLLQEAMDMLWEVQGTDNYNVSSTSSFSTLNAAATAAAAATVSTSNSNTMPSLTNQRAAAGAILLKDEEDGYEDSLEMDDLVARVTCLIKGSGASGASSVASAGTAPSTVVMEAVEEDHDSAKTSSTCTTVPAGLGLGAGVTSQRNSASSLPNYTFRKTRSTGSYTTTFSNSSISTSNSTNHHNRSISAMTNATFDTSTSETNENPNPMPSLLNNAALWTELDATFTQCDQQTSAQDRMAEFQSMQAFVRREQMEGQSRRLEARALEASEETRLAFEVAQLKGLRLQAQNHRTNDDFQWKLAHSERSYVSRKMVFAKAAQVAGCELRLQFSRVRDFLESLHTTRQRVLYSQHRRQINFQALMHGLRGTDARVISLDRQIQLRLYRKRKSDLNELHMTQTLEEAVYLEAMMDTLDKVQRVKQAAARDVFDLHITNLKQERNENERRNDELALFAASGTLEMAKLVAQYTAETAEDLEGVAQTQQHVDAMERNKQFDDATTQLSTTTLVISRLYDTVVWGAATNNLGLTSASGESSLYSSDYGSDYDAIVEDKEEEEDDEDHEHKIKKKRKTNTKNIMDVDDQADHDDYEASDEGVHTPTCLTPIGRMHSRQLAKELKVREKALLKKHAKEVRRERGAAQKASRALRAKHQAIIDQLIDSSLVERDALREAINERMEALRQRQEESTEQLKKRDLDMMREALFAEDQRVQDAESKSFTKAQELISAQVFHEVRNALSSVIAMSEMTNTLKADTSLTPGELVGSVDTMLDQIGDVVNYSLKMLNEVLDVSKINSGAFVPKTEAFDLEQVVTRATRMQQAKATNIKMSFVPSPQPCVGVSDAGIVERIVATLISNAVKFTTSGAVQPFIWRLERLQQHLVDGDNSMQAVAVGNSNESSTPSYCNENNSWGAFIDNASTTTSATSIFSGDSSSFVELQQQDTAAPVSDQLPLKNKRLRYMAVGVADTGAGLTLEKLQSAKFVISTSTSRLSNHGAQNTGFGLYHSHLQTRALNTELQLASIDNCWDLLNDDMRWAYKRKRTDSHTFMNAEDDESTNGMDMDTDLPGKGTVLYFTIPIFEDGPGAQKALEDRVDAAIGARKALRNKTHYLLRPMPPPANSLLLPGRGGANANNGRCFKILVADDVMMLRKGMIHTIGKLWTKNFPNCPVSVSSACSAEDVLRAVHAEPFDLVVCDHHFLVDATKIKVIAPGPAHEGTMDMDPNSGRPSLVYDNNSIQQGTTTDGAAAFSHDNGRCSPKNSMKHFFDNERFTVEENDGAMLGLNALMEISTSTSLAHPKPLLMLVSGHTFDVDPGLGIVVVLKPLKHSDFIETLENHAADLYQTGICNISGKKGTLVNGRGSQVFVRSKQTSKAPTTKIKKRNPMGSSVDPRNPAACY